MNPPVVLDATAGVALALHSREGEWVAARIAETIAADSFVAVPEHFWAEAAGVLRRQYTHGTIPQALLLTATQRLLGLTHTTRRFLVAELLEGALAWRHNLTIADALYVNLAPPPRGTPHHRRRTTRPSPPPPHHHPDPAPTTPVTHPHEDPTHPALI